MIFTYMETGPLMVNCYIVGDEDTKEAAVIDPGGSEDQILMALAKLELKCILIINTHAHFDHVGANAELARVTGAPIACHKAEAGMLPNISKLASAFGMKLKNSPPAEKILEEGDIVEIGKVKMEVLHIPGHSPGSICLVIREEKKVIVGDVLFQSSIGRTDLPGGSLEMLLNGIKEKLFPLGDDFEVFPGHGPSTKIGVEREHNPFLKEGAINYQ